MNGILYGVGVGPGDPELLTGKAVRVIGACGVIAIPHRDPGRCFAYQIASGAVPAIETKPKLCIDMPMTHDQSVREAAYETGTDALCAALAKGEDVAFLTLGDPSVYSTFAYLAERVRTKGFPVRWIPGVPSFCAAAAALGEPLCTDREQLHLIPGGANAETALAYPGTKVFMKGELAPLLKAIGDRGLTAAAVENCGTEHERIYGAASDIPEDAGYYLATIVKEKQA
jgi:precorrin-2/cobalt-factor-2 C20-methyltransferase